MKVHIRAGISFVLLAALVAFVAFLVVHPYLLGIAPSPFAKEEISLEEG